MSAAKYVGAASSVERRITRSLSSPYLVDRKMTAPSSS
jgi:hypothetical protein